MKRIIVLMVLAACSAKVGEERFQRGLFFTYEKAPEVQEDKEDSPFIPLPVELSSIDESPSPVEERKQPLKIVFN